MLLSLSIISSNLMCLHVFYNDHRQTYVRLLLSRTDSNVVPFFIPDLTFPKL